MVKLTKIGWEIFYDTNSTSEREIIEKSLSYFNENSRFSNNQYWDGYVKFFDKKRKCFNYGNLPYVISKLDKKSILYSISNIDLDTFQPSIPYNKDLRPHQLASLYSFFQTKYGIIKVPTRGGKTFIASEAIRLILNDNPEFITLFIVDSVVLFKQAVSDISGYLKMDKKDIGFIRDGKFNLKQINVTTIQTLQSIYYGPRNINKFKTINKVKVRKTNPEIRQDKKNKQQNKQKLVDFLNLINFSIVDECHMYTSEDRINIVKETKISEFNLFLSATPYKSEDRFANLAMRGLAGDILYEIPEQELKNKGYLAQDKIILIRINHENNKNINFDELSGYSDYVDKLLINNKDRNQIAINVIEVCRKMKLKILVLFFYKKHGLNLSKITSDPFITGDNKANYIEEIKQEFLENKDGGVLLASNIFNKGITLPEVEVMINIGGGKEQSSVIQKKGRVLGVTDEKKKALIIDFIDESEYFLEHSLSRLEVYEESVGIDNIIVFDATDEDFYTELREFVKQWFDESL